MGDFLKGDALFEDIFMRDVSGEELCLSRVIYIQRMNKDPNQITKFDVCLSGMPCKCMRGVSQNIMLCLKLYSLECPQGRVLYPKNE